MQIQISWLLMKPTDLDLHCLQRQGISGFSKTRKKFDFSSSVFNRMFFFSWQKCLGLTVIHPLYASKLTPCPEFLAGKFGNSLNFPNPLDLNMSPNKTEAGLGGSVGCASDWRPEGRGFDPRPGQQHSFVEIDHEIFSTVILSLPLIQEGQLSVSGERMCTILVNRLED